MANYATVVRNIARVLKNSPLQACMVWGAPGCGKSHAMSYGLPEALQLPIECVRMFRPSNHDPVDLTGLPNLTDGKTVFCTPDLLLELNRTAEQYGACIFNVDEVNQSVPMMYNTLNGLFLDRRIGTFVLDPRVRIVATGNRQSDKAASNRMPSHTANRFFHQDMDSDFQGWSIWALKNGIPPWIVAYIQMKPGNLNTFDADKRENATERTWEMFARAAGEDIEAGEVGELASGFLGEGVAAELQAFRKVMDDMPNPDGCLLDPKNSPLPNTLSGKYAMAGAMAARARKGNLDSVLTYMGRLEKQFEVLTVRGAYLSHPEITATAAFIQWSAENSTVFTSV